MLGPLAEVERIRTVLAEYKKQDLPGDLPNAGILVPIIVSDSGVLEVILTVRAGHLNSHAGEIAFPGGKEEEGDESLIGTALRESYEEIDLPPEEVEILGLMDQMVSKAGIRVESVVGLVASNVKLKPNPDELDKIFHVPLQFFLDTEPKIRTFRYDGASWEMPEYSYEGHRIWGLTSMIIVNLINIVYKLGLPKFKRPEFIKFEK